MKEHQPNCPRLQFWDAGEWEAPCTCVEDAMKIKPTKPDEHGVRWCSAECDCYTISSGNLHEKCTVTGYSLPPDCICEPWAREMVGALQWCSGSGDFARFGELMVSKASCCAENEAEVERLRKLLSIERLAALEHEQWMHWAKAVEHEVSEERRRSWAEFFVPYEELSESFKELDREWARKVIEGE